MYQIMRKRERFAVSNILNLHVWADDLPGDKFGLDEKHKNHQNYQNNKSHQDP